jgi:hypothetical protein
MVGLQIFLNKKGYKLSMDGKIGPQTKKALKEYIVKTFYLNNYRFSPVMLVWIRTDNKLSNTFDDFVVLLVHNEIELIFKATTTAGDFYIFNPITSGGITGTAITKPQQARMSHQFLNSFLGMPYFRQQRPIKIYRDGNKDRNLEIGLESFGMYGIHFHHMGLGNLINNWSAGCNGTSKKDWAKICSYFFEGDWEDYTLID